MILAQLTQSAAISSFDWLSLANMIAAAVAAGTATIAVYYSYWVLRMQADPSVVLYVEADIDRPSVMNLVLVNQGKGVARMIQCDFSDWVPDRAFGFDNAPMPGRMKDGPLFSTIPALGPNEKRVITWGQYGGLKKGLEGRSVSCTISYHSDRLGPIRKKRLQSTFPIEVDSFAGTDASDRNFQGKIANHLDRLAKVLEHSASGSRPLKIIVEEFKPGGDQEV
jgi:hypothetical protein